ncbi:LuxR C-terminal-related transcriptional regulator [uncultured Phenylobacterium sp.]|uniref:helix-turn-helix transcriptional regulator n=1 Tax=uncultured Phenylobacterium sp. TaxID=349273 RepID=UPI0025E8D7CA|nr:LuxR C-terminal-related transcriptional regulator [uncultured Phenylobacterium sp.]
MLKRAMSFADGALAAATPEAASEAFFGALSDLGASYLQTRLYRRPLLPLTSAAHFAAGGIVARIAPETWREGSAAFDYVCFENNPLLEAIRGGLTRYRFSDFAPREQASFGGYWEAMSEAGIGDAVCATSYGAHRTIASLHLGFREPDLGPQDALAIQLAGLMLTERLMTFASPPGDEDVRLTARERDTLGWVAEGKSDWDISVILGLSETTVRFHVDNARRKLGAVNRTQAVARLAAARLL